jgi:Leucine-rich repeat (LRR) protein
MGEMDLALNYIGHSKVMGFTTLDLSFLGLTELPRQLRTLTHLKHLNLSGNHLKSLPK